jgi:hypothetical protein
MLGFDTDRLTLVVVVIRPAPEQGSGAFSARVSRRAHANAGVRSHLDVLFIRARISGR